MKRPFFVTTNVIISMPYSENINSNHFKVLFYQKTGQNFAFRSLVKGSINDNSETSIYNSLYLFCLFCQTSIVFADANNETTKTNKVHVIIFILDGRFSQDRAERYQKFMQAPTLQIVSFWSLKRKFCICQPAGDRTACCRVHRRSAIRSDI